MVQNSSCFWVLLRIKTALTVFEATTVATTTAITTIMAKTTLENKIINSFTKKTALVKASIVTQ